MSLTQSERPDDKRMRLRYSGTCHLCGTAIAAGTPAVYERSAKRVRCLSCPTDTVPEEPDEPTAAVALAESTEAASVAATTSAAGASARREYERRKAKREERIRANHPKLGGLILALSDDPQSTKAWAQGAVGEELLAKRLAEVPAPAVAFHDRRIRGTRANIDHIVVAPSGVWVIDAKRYRNKRPSLRVDGGIIRPRIESLRIGGRDGTKLVSGVQSQVARVEHALAGLDVPIRGVLCFLEGDWPLFGGGFQVNGVRVVWPRLLVKQITAAEAVDVSIDEIVARIETAFPSA